MLLKIQSISGFHFNMTKITDNTEIKTGQGWDVFKDNHVFAWTYSL